MPGPLFNGLNGSAIFQKFSLAKTLNVAETGGIIRAMNFPRNVGGIGVEEGELG
jgi:hypothetical protein